MYLALHMISLKYCTVVAIADTPFRRLTLLLHLREYALCLVVLAMRARGHLAITLDLLLSAHIAGLHFVSVVTLSPRLYVPWLSFSSSDRLGHCDRPYRPAQTCSGEAATDRTDRCQRCAEAAGSSLAAVRRSSRSARCSWWQGQSKSGMRGACSRSCWSWTGVVVVCGMDALDEKAELNSRPAETQPGSSSAETWKCRRRPAGGRIASSRVRVRQKLV